MLSPVRVLQFLKVTLFCFRWVVPPFPCWKASDHRNASKHFKRTVAATQSHNVHGLVVKNFHVVRVPLSWFKMLTSLCINQSDPFQLAPAKEFIITTIWNSKEACIHHWAFWPWMCEFIPFSCFRRSYFYECRNELGWTRKGLLTCPLSTPAPRRM